MTNMPNFIDEALRTYTVDAWHPLPRQTVLDYLRDASNSLAGLDEIKKAMIYGKNKEKFLSDTFGPLLDLDPYRRGILHAILGIATEAGELIDAMLAHLEQGKPLDEVNLKEELGDLDWYEALLAHKLNVTFEETQAMNVRKLRARYPDKFTSELAINRNTIVERGTLEMVDVDSSNIEKIGYSPDTQKLRVKFKTSGTYEYDDVPMFLYKDLILADSIGIFFNANVKTKFEYRKIAA